MKVPQWREMDMGDMWYLEYVFLVFVGNIVVAGGLEHAYRRGVSGAGRFEDKTVHTRATRDMRRDEWAEDAKTVRRSQVWG